jgi:hypothetical protein
MMKLRDVAGLLWFCCLSACATQRSNLNRAATLDRAGPDAVVVLAVEPRSRVWLFEGESDGWTWRRTNSRAVAKLWDEGGFVVLRLPQRIGHQSYGVGLVTLSDLRGPMFIAHQGNGIPVVHAPAGQVTFVGGLTLRPRGNSLSAEIDETATLERAQRFMQQTYPGLPPIAATESLELVPAHDGIEIDRSDRTLSGFAVGFFTGPSRLKGPAAERAVAGPGEASLFTLTLSLWDQLALGFTAGRVKPHDRKPFSQVVVECTEEYGSESCGDPRSVTSDILATTVSVETGYQRRFRPWRAIALLPSVLVGYTWNPDGLSRRIVACDDCKTIPIPGVSARGAYVAPIFKLTFLSGLFALGVRSEIFLTGDVAHRTMLGLEFGAP